MVVVVEVDVVVVNIVVKSSSDVVSVVFKEDLSVVNTNLGCISRGLGVCFFLALIITPPGTLVMNEVFLVVEAIAVVTDDVLSVVVVVVLAVVIVVDDDLGLDVVVEAVVEGTEDCFLGRRGAVIRIDWRCLIVVSSSDCLLLDQRNV